MKDYIKEDKVCSEEDIEKILNEYDRINKFGIPAYNFVLLKNDIVKVIVYLLIVILLSLIK